MPPGVAATIELRDASQHPAGAGRKALAVMPGGALELHGGKGLRLPFARLGATAAAGAAVLSLDADAAAGGWADGDEVAVSSTDFDPFQTERAVVIGVDGGRLTLAAPLRFKHFGEVTAGVDQRAEVSHRWSVGGTERRRSLGYQPETWGLGRRRSAESQSVLRRGRPAGRGYQFIHQLLCQSALPEQAAIAGLRRTEMSWTAFPKQPARISSSNQTE